MEEKKLKAYVYLRFGNASQIDNDEEQQKKLFEAYLMKKRKNVSINYYIDKGYSGLNFDRPGFKKMIKDIETNKVDMIVVSDYSRIGRNIIKVEEFIEKYLIPRNIELICTKYNNELFNPIELISLYKDIRRLNNGR